MLFILKFFMMVTRLLLPHSLYFWSFKLLICEVETINLGMLGYLPRIIPNRIMALLPLVVPSTPAVFFHSHGFQEH